MYSNKIREPSASRPMTINSANREGSQRRGIRGIRGGRGHVARSLGKHHRRLASELTTGPTPGTAAALGAVSWARGPRRG
jgi:hypothetical protein